MLNITQSTMSNIERRKNDITLEIFFKTFDIFGSVIIYVGLLAYFNVDINEKIKKVTLKKFISCFCYG